MFILFWLFLKPRAHCRHQVSGALVRAGYVARTHLSTSNDLFDKDQNVRLLVRTNGAYDCLMHSQTAQAIEPAGSSDIVVAPHLPADSWDRVAAPSEHDPQILRDPQAEQALHGDGPVIKAFVKPRRAAFRLEG